MGFKPGRGSYSGDTRWGNAASDDHQFTGSVHVSGTLYANAFQIDSLIERVSITQEGSSKFGNDVADEHQFTGSLLCGHLSGTFISGSKLVVGDIDSTTQPMRIHLKDNTADAFNILEGTNSYLKFVTTNTSEEIVCGKNFAVDGGTINVASGPSDIKIVDNNANSFAIKEGSTSYITFATTDGQESVQFPKSPQIMDDVKLYFGTGADVSFKIDSAVSDRLVISGSAGGVEFGLSDNHAAAFHIRNQGAESYPGQHSFMRFVTTNNQEEIIVQKNLTLRSGDLKIENDLHNTTFEQLYDDGSMASGEVLYYGPAADTSLTTGQLYYLKSDGVWTQADADAAATGKSLLGIALGASARDDGMLLRGFVKVPATEVLNVPGGGASDGLPVYISTTAGHFDFTAPSGGSDVERVVGYCVDDDGGAIMLWFSPDGAYTTH